MKTSRLVEFSRTSLLQNLKLVSWMRHPSGPASAQKSITRPLFRLKKLACVFKLKLFSIFCYANLNQKKAVGHSLRNFVGPAAGAFYAVRNINKTYEFLRKVDNRINHGCRGKFLLNKKFLLCLGPRTLISVGHKSKQFSAACYRAA